MAGGLGKFRHEVFCDPRTSETHKRQRDLVLALGRQTGLVEVSQIPGSSPAMARAYARLTPKGLQRNLNHVFENSLIERRHGKVRAKREIILAFLPARAALPELNPPV